VKLSLIAHSPDVETLIATSMLTTTSGAAPSTLYDRLRSRPVKVADVVSRASVQHGNILEHNRFIWRLEASRDEVLEILLRSKYFNVTEASPGVWVLSCSLRTIAEYHQTHPDRFSRALLESIKEAVPHIYGFISGETG